MLGERNVEGGGATGGGHPRGRKGNSRALLSRNGLPRYHGRLNRRAGLKKISSRLPELFRDLLLTFVFFCALCDAGRAVAVPEYHKVHGVLPAGPPKASPSLVLAIVTVQALLLVWLFWPFLKVAAYLYAYWGLPVNWRNKIPVWARAPFCDSSRHTLYREFTRYVSKLLLK